MLNRFQSVAAIVIADTQASPMTYCQWTKHRSVKKGALKIFILFDVMTDVFAIKYDYLYNLTGSNKALLFQVRTPV